jgi:serine/threonine protein kinase/Tol biopolymer transport system component
MDIVAGTRIGKYEVKELLGAGGMGEVYRAFDAELKRHVALKFIPADIASDPKRMRRFEQEALAASALNHPNIVTVYDIGQTEWGRRFFVTELVEGVTLREYVQSRRLKLGEVLDIAAQVASALVEAHGAGVVHRDIKPDNVMVRRDGYVKVLDFGLAKMTGKPSNYVDTQADTQALVRTDAGAVMGTVSYMSPEQAGGQEVDGRTDIWSLGVVLYELLTGRLPFKGKSASHTIVSILDDEPPPLTAYLPEAPESLQEVVSDALAKDREARFQTAKQMLAKLHRLKRRLDAGGNLDTTISPEAAAASGEASGRATALSPHGGGSTLAGAHTTARSGDLFRTPTSPEEAHATAPGERRRRFGPFLLVGAFAGLAVAAFAAYYFVVRPRMGASAPFAPLSSMKLTRVPASGATFWAAISPDGKYAARVVIEAGVQSLRLRQLSTTGERDLIPPDPGLNFSGAPTFSHDGAYVYYVAGKKGQLFRELFRVSLFGGAPQKLVYDVDSGVTISPDGKRLAFRRHLPQTREDTLVVTNEDGTGEQTLATYKVPLHLDVPAWSPDGRRIAYYVSGTDAGGYYINLDAVSVGDRRVETISAARWRSVSALAWVADGSGLVITARDRPSLPNTPLQLWYVAYPGGEAQKITNDLNNYVGLSATADTRTLLVKQGRDTTNIWLAPGGDGARARQLTSSGINGGGGVSWLPDGRVVYDSDASGNTDIWVMNPDGTAARQLTFDPNVDTVPAATPDGRYIFFRSNRGVGWSVWRMSPDGSNAREIVSNVDNNQTMGLQFSPDSRWLYYVSRDEKAQPAVWRVLVEGGQPEKIISEKIGYIRLSPDGKTFFSTHMESVPDATAKIYFFNAEGGAPVREMELPPDMLDARDWSPDSQAIDYVVTREGAANLWRLPLAPGARPRQLTDWKSDQIYRFSWSPGGRQLAAARGAATTDLVLIQNFR